MCATAPQTLLFLTQQLASANLALISLPLATANVISTKFLAPMRLIASVALTRVEGRAPAMCITSLMGMREDVVPATLLASPAMQI